MIKAVVSAILLLLSVGGYAQETSPRQADSLRKAAIPANAGNRFAIFLRLAEFQILKPGELKKDLDSSAMFISMAEKACTGIKLPDAYGRLLYTKSLLLKEQGHRLESHTLMEKAIAALAHTSNQTLLGNAYAEYSRYYDDYNNKYEVARRIDILKEAISAYTRSNNKLELGKNYRLLADLYDQEDDFVQVLTNLNKSLQNFKAIKYPDLQGIYVLFADMYNNNGDYQKALSYDLIALKTCSERNDTTMQLCEIQNITGHTYSYLHDFKKAGVYYREALKTAIRYKDIRSEILLGGNIAITEMKLHHEQTGLDIFDNVIKHGKLPMDKSTRLIVDMEYLSLYASMKNFKMGQIYFNRIRYQDNMESLTEDDLMSAYYSLCRFLFNSRQYELCRMYNQKHFDVASRTHVASEIAIVYQLAYELDSAQNRYKSAVNNLRHFKEISDSLTNVKKNRQVYELQIAYETEKKEDEIRARDQNIRLLKQKGRLEQANLNKAMLVKNVTIVGIVLVGAIAGLLYRQSRLRQRNNKTITFQNELITRKNELLQKLVAEKDWLLKEVNHRVKNNLHMVISLLESQAIYLENDALKAMETSKHRIFSMSLIHQKLYQSEDVKTVDMSIYLPELVNYLRDSFDARRYIHFSLGIEPVQLSVSEAIPLALILNEAITNSIKYAFPGNRLGEISIKMRQTGENIELIIRDNGVGMAKATEDTDIDSLGLKLMRGLIEELSGQIQFENNNGTIITITFEHSLLLDTDSPQADYLVST